MKYTLGIFVLAAVISLMGLGLMLYSTPLNGMDANNAIEIGNKIDQQQPSSRAETPPISHPPPLDLSRMGLKSLEEVQSRMAEQKANFSLKIPTNLPPGYKVIGAWLGELGAMSTNPITKTSFRTQSAEIWMWHQNLAGATNNREVLDSGGVFYRITHTAGYNSTIPFSSFNNPPKSVVTYLWGHPAVITYGEPSMRGTPDGQTIILVYHSGRQVGYYMSSSLPADTLLKMMESIVKDP